MADLAGADGQLAAGRQVGPAEFAAVAGAIAASEPVIVAVCRHQWAHARDVLPPAVRVMEMSTDDSKSACSITTVTRS